MLLKVDVVHLALPAVPGEDSSHTCPPDNFFPSSTSAPAPPNNQPSGQPGPTIVIAGFFCPTFVPIFDSGGNARVVPSAPIIAPWNFYRIECPAFYAQALAMGLVK